MTDLRTRAGAAYFAYLRRRWQRRGEATLRLAGRPFRFAGITEDAHAWFGYEVHRGRWERTVLACYAESIRPGDTVFDIGAYLGPYAMLGSAATGPSGRVLTFEPDPVARQLLERNLRLNGIKNVEIVDVAVSDGSGVLRLGNLGTSQATRTADAGLEVRTVGLDDFCAERGLCPAVIKIDVEGGEEQIITHAGEKTLREARAVIVEIHRGVDDERITRQFEQWGKSRRVLETRWGEQYNALYA